MSQRAKEIAKESVRAILTLLIIVAVYVIVTVAGFVYEESLNKKVQDSDYPFRTTEELRRMERYHGVSGFEIKVDPKTLRKEWVFYRNSEWCKAFPKKKD